MFTFVVGAARAYRTDDHAVPGDGVVKGDSEINPQTGIKGGSDAAPVIPILNNSSFDPEAAFDAAWEAVKSSGGGAERHWFVPRLLL
jgi:hypothetical protein